MFQTMRRGLLLRVGFCLTLISFEAAPMVAQSQVLETAIKFYEGGGSYCFRIIPPGIDKSTEKEWTMMVLTGKGNPNTSFAYGDIQQPGKKAFDLVAEGLAVQIVWVENRTEFFARFADGITAGRFRTRVVKIGPVKPGAQVSFAKAADLKPDQFLGFIKYTLE